MNEKKFCLSGIRNGMEEEIFCGETIGHKRWIRLPKRSYDKIKLVLDEYRGKLYIKCFAAYRQAD